MWWSWKPDPVPNINNVPVAGWTFDGLLYYRSTGWLQETMAGYRLA
jgi:hypothetical protein